jgi:hypothetical protein
VRLDFRRGGRVEKGLSVGTLLRDYGLLVSVLVAVAITTAFAFVLDASESLVGVMLVLGLVTALLEHVLGSDSERRR